ncbi:hypothetical protein CMO83_04695 [Candidatus Woesearchaeota archaeon]|jgi:hypothetical protein|nr:hypothetical protein [Candidatus Woesearchaeota archaeon]|tara:strand:- start:12630 stop:13775 length:1146 start_codon:yes stop_codon:yes gene_type:complete
MGTKYNEPNIMRNYSRPSNPLYRAMGIIRRGIRTGNHQKLDAQLLSDAEQEFQYVKAVLDNSTYSFALDLAQEVLGKGPTKRVVLVVNGKFVGDEEHKSTLGIDLGTNPHELYRAHSIPGSADGYRETIDDYMARTKTGEFLSHQRESLQGRGIEGFLIEGSKFFYFNDRDLLPFMQDEVLDTTQLLPLVTETVDRNNVGYVDIHRVELPSFEHYRTHSPPFVSYRLKRSFKRKNTRTLVQRVIDEDDVVSDGAAHRVGLATEDEVHEFARDLKQASSIRRSGIKIIKMEDYYDEPKENGFRSYKFIGKVTAKSHPEVTREIQLVDRDQYYRNEIDPNDPAHHLQQVKKEEAVGLDIPEHYLIALQRIFGSTTMLVPLSEL